MDHAVHRVRARRHVRASASGRGSPRALGASRMKGRDTMETRIFSAVLLICMLVNAGCAVHNKAYLGPARSLEEVGVVSPAVEKGFRRRSVAILKIDGQDNIDEWRGGNAGYVYVLPGEHTFLV